MKAFAELTGQERAVEILRWLLVPVAAVSAVFVLLLISQVAMPPVMAPRLGEPRPGPDPLRTVMARTFGMLMGVAIVLARAKTAPRRRLATALVLAGLWIGYSFLIHVYVHLGRGMPNLWHFALAVGASLFGVAVVGYAERSHRPRGNL
jgi:hypothetical protein